MGSHHDGKFLTTSDYLSSHLLDLPGHGQSSQRASFESLKTYLDELNSDFHLIGYSFGGRIAQKLSFHPRCLSLTLMSSKTHFSDKERNERLNYENELIQDLNKTDLDHFIDKFYSSSLFSSFKRRKRLFESYLLRRMDLDKQDLIYALKEFSITKLHTSFPSIPILGMYGMLDLKYRHHYSGLNWDISVVSVPSSGHVIHYENPSFCVKTLEKFIGQIENDLASLRTL